MASTSSWFACTLLAAANLVACSKTPSAPTTTTETGNPVGTVTIQGTIRDHLPTGDGAPVPGAQVQVIYKTERGVSVVSGADGAYRIEGVHGGAFFQLQADRAGYETTVLRLAPLTVDSTVDLAITPILKTLTGIVTETPPTETTAVAGARIEVLTGSNKGRTTTTDARGAYSLPQVWGDFDVSISAPEHETQTAHASVGTSDRLDVKLVSRMARVHTAFTGDLCTTARLAPWQVCSQPFERTHTIPVHQAGIMSLNVDYHYQGDYNVNYLTLEVRCGSVAVLEKRFSKHWEAPTTVLPDGVRGPIQVALTQPCGYEFRLFNFIADTKGGHQTTYRVDVDHPK